MSFLLDTDTVSTIIKERSESAERRLAEVEHGSVFISVITLGELRFGSGLKTLRDHVRLRLDAMLRVVEARSLKPEAAERYGELRAYLQKKGTPIGPNDLWLAAHALSEDLTLVTNNEREFKRVPKLRVENWLS